MGLPLLEFRNVTKEFKVGGVFSRGRVIKALDDVSFEIPSDKPIVLAIVGESGSGKTTIARLILGLIRPTRGSVLYKGRSVGEWLKTDSTTFRREVQPIFQDPYSIYNPYYRVDRVLYKAVKKFNLASSSEDARKLIVESLEAVGLRPRDVLGRYPHQLSGGERQRLMLARILLLKPKLLIADEPVSMIDASLRAIFLNDMLKLKNELNMSTIFITHDLNIASYIADQIIVLLHGSIIEKGSLNQVLNNPLHPYTRLLMESIPIPDPSMKWKGITEHEVRAATLAEVKKEIGCKFYYRCPYAMPICEKSNPPPIEVERNHHVSCFLYSKNEAEGGS